MRHVERHIIKQNNPIWQQIDDLCFLSKNLYNHANYLIRQSFILEGVYLGFNQIYHQVKKTTDYQALPRKVSQQVLRIEELIKSKARELELMPMLTAVIISCEK